MDDSLVLVDAADRSVGYMSKAQCHEGRGTLHRAFSILLFNPAGELLIQQRAAVKRLWPLYWSNSVCSHPRGTETMEVATQRRLEEELGLRCPLLYLFKFEYHAQFDATGAEHELCSVFIGRCTGPLKVNRDEIADWRWITPDALNDAIARMGRAGGAPGDAAAQERRQTAQEPAYLPFTPWFLLEWARIWRDHRREVRALLE